MPEWVWIVIVLAIVIEAVVVVLWATLGKGRLTGVFAGMKDIRDFSTELDKMVREHMQANFSGRAEMLPEIFAPLLQKVRSMAAVKGVPFSEEMLRNAVIQIVAAGKFARRGDAAKAMDVVSRLDDVQVA